MQQEMLALLELSAKERKGLTFFLNGQTLPGVVTKVIGAEAVEARSQSYSRILIRLDKVLAVALT
jgi:hypothetical protein